ncbi:unnamed protein product [Cuscuta epithymum]|uniref:Late embryogenesis abundant protein LEA-2 subgroup domain-containing protein n=1 Tax=Cuscuta epithymum TaxID=186058 RepID=A0AAV0F3R6_9ASTE|nr:unnamed protein product [Cuscuta epithymum]
MVRTKTTEEEARRGKRFLYIVLGVVFTISCIAIGVSIPVLRKHSHHRGRPSYTVADAVLRNFDVGDDNRVAAATTVSFNLTVHNRYKDKSISFTNVSASFSFVYPEVGVTYLPGKAIANASLAGGGDAPITVPSSSVTPIPFQLRAIDGVKLEGGIEDAGHVKNEIETSHAVMASITVDAQVQVQNSATSGALHLSCDLTVSVNDYVDYSSTESCSSID